MRTIAIFQLSLLCLIQKKERKKKKLIVTLQEKVNYEGKFLQVP